MGDPDSEVSSSDEGGVGSGVDQGGSKSARIEVAKSAVAGAVKREALSAADKQRRYREKHGDAYREREKGRMKRRRARIRGSPPSPED